MRFSLGVLGIGVIALVSIALPLQAQESSSDAVLPPFPNSCEPLPLVGGEGSEVSKEISPPGFNVPLVGPASAGIRNNWHTDWYLPGGQTYQRYLVIFIPHDNREYDVTMYLKYPDDTNQRFYREQRTAFAANEPITVEVVPERSDLAPYQVNTNIGGVQAVGARYSVVAAGCMS